MYLCDFHIHSQNSDGKLTISELVDAYGQRGFGAIAITDHLCETGTLLGQSAAYLNKTLLKQQFARYIFEIEMEAQRAWRTYGLLVIPGVEFTKNSFSHRDSAHILALGLRDYIDPNLEVPDLLCAIRAHGALSVAAHPVSTRKLEPQTYHLWDNRESYSKLFDAWEVASGPHLFEEVRDSGLPWLANSDLHQLRQMSSWKTTLDVPRSEGQVLAAIRHQSLGLTYYEDTMARAADSKMVKKSPPWGGKAGEKWARS